jgi:hypothetical protein
MSDYTRRQPARKSDHGCIDDDGDRDWVARSIARKFGLSANVAHLVCELARIGAGEDRAPASGGRTK